MASLTTLGNVKEYLTLTNTASDSLLSNLILRASAFIITKTKNNILSADYTETRNGTGSTRLMLANRPVTAISSLVIGSHAVSPATSPNRRGFWFDKRFVYVHDYSFYAGFSNVTISYTAGYDEVPYDIEQVAIELVTNKFKRKDRIGENSKNINGMVVSYSTADLSGDHADILKKYTNNIPI